MTFYKNDMQRLQGLRIEEESRRRDEETQARAARAQRLNAIPRHNRLGGLATRIRSMFRRA